MLKNTCENGILVIEDEGPITRDLWTTFCPQVQILKVNTRPQIFDVKSFQRQKTITTVIFLQEYYNLDIKTAAFEGSNLDTFGPEGTPKGVCDLSNSHLSEILGHAFYGAAFQKVILPKEVLSFQVGCFGRCGSITAFDVEVGSTKIKIADGIVFSKDGSELMLYPLGKPGPIVSISDNIQKISMTAFDVSNFIEIIYFSPRSQCTFIGSYFLNVSPKITTVYLPPKIASVGTGFLELSQPLHLYLYSTPPQSVLYSIQQLKTWTDISISCDMEMLEGFEPSVNWQKRYCSLSFSNQKLSFTMHQKLFIVSSVVFCLHLILD